jgi:hypothetical protein
MKEIPRGQLGRAARHVSVTIQARQRSAHSCFLLLPTQDNLHRKAFGSDSEITHLRDFGELIFSISCDPQSKAQVQAQAQVQGASTGAGAVKVQVHLHLPFFALGKLSELSVVRYFQA